MNEYVRSGRMQRARDLGADAARTAGDQHHLAAQRRAFSILGFMRRNDTAMHIRVNSMLTERASTSTARACRSFSRQQIAAAAAG